MRSGEGASGLFTSLGHLPGGLARFVPCQPSAHYTRLLHVGWGQCGHDLSSRPLIHSLMFFWCTLKGQQPSFMVAP